MTKRIAPDTPAVYVPNPLNMGAFRDCPDEIIAQVVARVLSSGDLFTAVKHVSLVCKAFQWISNQHFTFNFYLDDELKEKKTFVFENFVVYRRLFEQKYRGVLASPEIFAKYPQFMHLDIVDPKMDDKALAALIDGALAAGCQVQSLKLNTRLITTLDLSRLKSLRELHLSDCKQMKAALDFTGLDQLESLTLIDCEKLSGLMHLNKLKNLKKLEVEGCFQLQGPLHLKDLSQLNILRWKGTMEGLLVAGCLDLKGFSQLEMLDLVGCDDMRELLGLNELKSLKVFRLNAYTGPLQQFDLDGLDQLEHLDLIDWNRLTALLRLSSLHRLKTLHLVGCSQLSEALDLDGLDQLEELILTDCTQLTRLHNMNKLLHLKEIDVRFCDKLIIAPSELPPGVHVQTEDPSSEDEDSDVPPIS